MKRHFQQKSRKAERELRAILKKLPAYRRRDPNFEQAIKASVEAEAKYGDTDPAEGTPCCPSDMSDRSDASD